VRPHRREDSPSPDDGLWQELEADWRLYEGEQVALSAVRLGFIGLFLFGVVLGPWALARVWQAESLGVRTNLGEVLGWVATFLGLMHVAFGIMYLSL
jgi:hypothetical protein